MLNIASNRFFGQFFLGFPKVPGGCGVEEDAKYEVYAFIFYSQSCCTEETLICCNHNVMHIFKI